MKKILFLIVLLVLATACETTNNHKRGSVKTIEQTVAKDVTENQVKNSKETQIASMPDVSVFFPEEVKEDKKYSSSIWGVEKKSLYADSKASIIGDIVFVQIKESANAKIDYSKNKSGYTNYAGEPPAVSQTVFVNKNSIRGDYADAVNGTKKASTTTGQESTYTRPNSDAYNGNSAGKSSFAFEGQIAARIIGTDKYGNLFLKGTKTALVNNEIVVLELSGFVRGQDIKSDNTIDSELVENMEFLYNGALYVRQPIINKEIGSNADTIIMTPVDETNLKKTDSPKTNTKTTESKKI